MTTQPTTRAAYSTLTISPHGDHVRTVTSAIHPTTMDAALAAELDVPVERHIDWFEETLPLDGWLYGVILANNDEAPYVAPVMVHPASATQQDIATVWRHIVQTSAARRITSEANAHRARQGRALRPMPTFHTSATTPNQARNEGNYLGRQRN